MKKIVLLMIGLILILTSNAWCGFNYGTDTYATDASTLILNSTGDQTVSSTMGSLGTNDFIGELGVKNTLQYEGYTTAIDANNPMALAQCYSQYNQPLPNGGAGYTQLKFAGLNGDPRATQNVYVLTSEYNRLSAQGQASSIDNLNTGLSLETMRAIDGETIIQGNINNEATTRSNADATLQTNINGETTRATGAENNLQGNINTVDTNSKGRDTVLQSNINTEATTRGNADNVLQGGINSLNSTVAGQQAQLNNHDKRIHNLEKTQVGVRTQVNFIREKNYEVGVYGVYDATRSTASEVGLAITIGIGESWTDRELDKMNKKLEKMEAMFTNNVKRAGVTDVQLKTEKTDKGMRISIDKEGTAKLLGRF